MVEPTSMANVRCNPLVRVAPFSERQHGLIARRQLLEHGVSRHEIRTLLNARTITRLRRGVYVLTGARRSWEQALLGATLATGEGAVASHASAARLWRMKFTGETGFEVVVPRGRQHEIEGVRVHTSSVLEEVDVTTRDDVPCTTFARTLCDRSTELTQLQLGRALDDGLRRRVTSITAVEAAMLRLDSGPGRRLSIIQPLVEQRGNGFVPGGSNAELRVIRALNDAGMPPPVQQLRVRAGGKTYFLDYAYPELRRFIEYYELRSHGTPSAVAYDSDRITDLVGAGWHPLIFTDANSDSEIVAAVRDMLATHTTGTARRAS
jgi:hypothetical protein